MNQTSYRIGDYRFYSMEEYKAGLRDIKKIKTLMQKGDLSNPKVAAKLYQQLISFPDMFETCMGEEFTGKLLQCARGQGSSINRMLAMLDDAVCISSPITVPKEQEESRFVSVKPEKIPKVKPEKIPRVKRKRGKGIAKVFAAAMLCIMLYFIGDAIYYQVASYKSIKNLEALAAHILEPSEQKTQAGEEKKSNFVNGADTGDSLKEDIIPVDVVAETGILSIPSVLYMYSWLYEVNTDMAGWIRIDGTAINYPVMQTKEDEEFYLRRNFYKEDDINGLPFMDSRCDIRYPTSNTIIYAHNMKNGAMFAGLLNYKQEAFYREHKIIQFDTVYEEAEYEIVAAFLTRVANKDEDVFRYYWFIEADTPEDYEEFVREIKAISYYDTGVDAAVGDQLLTLSTCDRSIEDGRFVVVARKIAEKSEHDSAQIGK